MHKISVLLIGNIGFMDSFLLGVIHVEIVLEPKGFFESFILT